MTIALLAALDTKGPDAAAIADRLESHGHHITIVDTGVLGAPTIAAHVPREATAAAGGHHLEQLRAGSDRALAVEVMARGARSIVAGLWEDGELEGVLGLGGGAGTTVASTAMQALPLGLPKVILTTVAAGQTAGYLGTSDIVLSPSVVDVAGVNHVSALTYARAADALSGMVIGARSPMIRAGGSRRRLVAASMFGVTTECVARATERLEAADCEVLVFHATGTGGRTLERLVAEGLVDAVLDLTTTEWADEVMGGILSAGPERLTAAAENGVPQVVSVGATDMANFGPIDSLPEALRGRRLYRHNQHNTLLRVDAIESLSIGSAIAQNLRRASAATVVMLPLRGVSALDRDGQPFDDPQARSALFDALRAGLAGSEVVVEEHDLHINDPAFADAAADRVLDLLAQQRGPAVAGAMGGAR